jgi:adenylylsulfate kinase
MLIILAGLPGTGKSTLAHALAERLHGHVLDKDRVRDALFGPDRIEFSTDQDDLVVSLMLQAASHIWWKDDRAAIILDGRVFSRNSQLRQVTDFADKLGQSWHVIECVCSADTARRRIVADHAGGTHPAANRNAALYDAVRARFEPIPQPKVIVDTEENVNLEELVSKLR